MKVCVVGQGGREHALQFVLSRDAEVIVSPGNPGIPGSTPAPPEEIDADLFVIGPEAPLSDGMADHLRADGKGVLVTESIDEAIDDVRDKLSGSSFGQAGRQVVIEEGMTGNELSVLA